MLGVLIATIVYAQTHQVQSIKPTENVIYTRPITKSSEILFESKGNFTTSTKLTRDFNERINKGLWGENSKIHPIRASKTISEEALRQYLAERNSPLADYSRQILASPYSSAIIAICTIEEYSCSVNPYGSNNFYGLMSQGHIIRYPTIESGIEAISLFLERADNNGRHTIESFRGWYCASSCENWESTVISTKETVENLQ